MEMHVLFRGKLPSKAALTRAFREELGSETNLLGRRCGSRREFVAECAGKPAKNSGACPCLRSLLSCVEVSQASFATSGIGTQGRQTID
jgi:hypothetical protein